MEFERKSEGDIELVLLKGDMDSHTSPKARDFFAGILKEEKKKLVVDLADVKYISSAGLATLIEVFQKMHRYGGLLKLCGMNETTKGIFEIAKLDSIFAIYETRDEAVSSFSS
ncbi:MAG: STAS domain-containing protein [Candidatus Aureabacteria bacterium]|nr:STAS domain-containing protein [Candidatus Auribacterota bacterium]